MEYRLRSFSPWLASISLDAAVGGDVVQDPAQVIFIISNNPYSTKPTVEIEDCMMSFFREAHCNTLHRTIIRETSGASEVARQGVAGKLNFLKKMYFFCSIVFEFFELIFCLIFNTQMV